MPNTELSSIPLILNAPPRRRRPARCLPVKSLGFCLKIGGKTFRLLFLAIGYKLGYNKNAIKSNYTFFSFYKYNL